MRPLLPLLLAVAPAAVALAAGVTTVSQCNRAFGAAQVILARGDALRLTNDDEFVHQIYVDAPGGYESDEQPPGEAVELRFPAAGRFAVRCHIHPRMLLQVEVR